MRRRNPPAPSLLLVPPRAALLLAALVACVHVACSDGDITDGGTDEPTMDSAVVDVNGLSPPLVCPGARGCRSGDGALLVGAAARAITPVVEAFTDENGNELHDEGEPFVDENGNDTWDGVFIAGFGMGRAATGVHDDQWARVVVLDQGDVRVALVAVDVVGVFHPDVMRVRRAVAERGLDVDHVMVASTHNHEAKDTMGIWGRDPSTTGYDDDYMERIATESALAIEEAIAARREARLVTGLGEAPALVADSRLPLVVDTELHTLAFVEPSGAPIAHVVVFGNHPEALSASNTLLTSDYPHFLRERVEAAFPGTTAVFFAGSLGGLMNPLGVIGCPDDDGVATCSNGDFAKAAYIGENLADLAILSLDDGVAVDEPTLALRRLPFFVPATNEVLLLAFKLGLLRRHAYLRADETFVGADKLVEVEIADIVRDMVLGTEVNAISLGDVEIMTVPGELYPELWLVRDDGSSYIESPEGRDHEDAIAERPIRATMRAARQQIVINNANDAIGYIIPKPQFDVVDPRAYESDGQYGEQNSLGAGTAPAVTEAAAAVSSLVVE